MLVVPVLVALAASAVTAEAPLLQPGDTWRYKNTVELNGRFAETHDESSIVRTEGDAVVVRVHQVDSTLQPTEILLGNDWSRFRSVDGQEQVVNRPFAFPLQPAKSWTVEYRESNPNRQHSSERLNLTYRVVGGERVTVPGGAFDTIKVEATGQWTATIAPAVTGSAVVRSDAQGAAVVNRLDRQVAHDATGRLYKAFWYAPAVKRAVKTIEEYYGSNGIRSETRTSELEGFTPAR